MPATVLGRTAYDLTQVLSPSSARSSDHPQLTFSSLRWRPRHGLRTTAVAMSVHMSTHVDSPSLYYQTGETIDQIGLERLCGSAVIVDADKGQWGEITDEDLEQAQVPIREGDIVVLRTGWHRHYWDEERYILKAPGLTKSGVDWLVNRGF
jgi:kynurenine formamidase